ncbi:MAG: amidohydrolase [Kineosporiaceae bacterium]
MTAPVPAPARPGATAADLATGQATGPATTFAADLVVTGARVRAVAGDWHTAVAVRAGVVSGFDGDALGQVGRGTRVVEASGGLVLPGFVDAHAHPVQAGMDLSRVWLHDVLGSDEYLRVVAAYARAHPEQEWIVGGGWATECFAGGAPRAEDLDRVSGGRPAFLFNRDVHGAWVNTAALRLAGITRNTPDPVDGRIERDPDGTPTGTLHEGAAYAFLEGTVPPPPPAQLRAGVLTAQAHLHALGVTSWQDAAVMPHHQDAYQALAADGRLLSRVVGALWWDRHRGLDQIEDFVDRREQARTARPAAGVPGFHAGTVKIMVDGVIENRTAALLEPYLAPHHHDAHGDPPSGTGTGPTTGPTAGSRYVSADLLAEAVTRLDRLGFQVHLHTIGDRAVRDALDAIAAAARANGHPGLRRHHLAHVQVVHPDDIPRFADLGVTANCQAFWAKHDRQMDDLTVPVLGPGRTAQQYPFASVHRAGGRLAMGSDWPVTTADPLPQLEVAVTRVPPDHRDDCDVPPLHPRERLPLAVALDAFTVGSAHVNHDPDGGRLRPGGRADLVVLDTDVTAPGFATADRAPLADVRVLLTVAHGRVVHDRVR